MWEELSAALRAKGYTVRCFPTAAAAADYLCGVIDGKTVGFGDSQTLLDMDLARRLSLCNQVHDPQSGDFFLEARLALNTQVFLTSVNAISLQGELVNLDGSGNRAAGSLFGHEQVFFILGRNKICPTLEAAVQRVRQVAAPKNAQRLGKKTPCALHGDRCYDCRSPERICNGLVIHLHKMSNTAMEVVLIDQELGL